MNEDIRLPNYNPAFCRNVAKWGAAICFVGVIAEICIFSLVDPTHGSCPGWTIHHPSGHPISLGVVFALTLFPAFWACFVFFRWKHFSQLIHAQVTGTYTPPPLLQALQDYRPIDYRVFPYNQVFLVVILWWSIFCTSPLWLMLFGCTGLLRYSPI